MVTIKMTAEDIGKILGKITAENIIQVLEKVDVQIESIQPEKAAGGCSFNPAYGPDIPTIRYTAEPGCHAVGVGPSSYAGERNPTKA